MPAGELILLGNHSTLAGSDSDWYTGCAEEKLLATATENARTLAGSPAR